MEDFLYQHHQQILEIFTHNQEGLQGTGVIVPAGTEYLNATAATFTETLYYYAEVNGVLCRDEQFIFFIHPLPLADDPADVVSCDNYILPALVNGNYFSGPNGSEPICG